MLLLLVVVGRGPVLLPLPLLVALCTNKWQLMVMGRGPVIPMPWSSPPLQMLALRSRPPPLVLPPPLLLPSLVLLLPSLVLLPPPLVLARRLCQCCSGWSGTWSLPRSPPVSDGRDKGGKARFFSSLRHRSRCQPLLSTRI